MLVLYALKSNKHTILKIGACHTLFLSWRDPGVASVFGPWILAPLLWTIVCIECVVLVWQDLWIVQCVLLVACWAHWSWLIAAYLDDIAIVGVSLLRWLVAISELTVLSSTMTRPSACALRRSYKCSHPLSSSTLSDMHRLSRLEIVLCSESRLIENIVDSLRIAHLVTLLVSSASHVAVKGDLSLCYWCLLVCTLVELDVAAVVATCVKSLLPRSVVWIIWISHDQAATAVEVSLSGVRVSPKSVANLRSFDELWIVRSMVGLMTIAHCLTSESLLLLVEEIQRLVSDAAFAMDWWFLRVLRITDSLGASVRWLSLACAVTLDLEVVTTVLVQALGMCINSPVVDTERLLWSGFCAWVLVETLLWVDCSVILDNYTSRLSIYRFLRVWSVEVDWCNSLLLRCILVHVQESGPSHSGSWEFVNWYLPLSTHSVVLEGHPAGSHARAVEGIHCTASHDAISTIIGCIGALFQACHLLLRD